MGGARIAARLLAAGACVLLFSCTQTNPDFCQAADECGEGRFCDLDNNRCLEGTCARNTVVGCSADNTMLLTCDATGDNILETVCEFMCNVDRDECNACEPSTSVCVSGTADELTVCAVDGTITDQRECFLGCRGDGESCTDVNPSNNLETDLDFIDNQPEAVRDVELADGFVVNFDGSIEDAEGTVIPTVDSRVQTQNGERSIRVFRVRSLVVSGAVSVIGDGPVAFVADRDIDIAGVLTVSAGRIGDRLENECVGEAPPVNGADRGGGGGGGFRTDGGDGGESGNANLGAGGTQRGNAALVPLLGGCDGGKAPGLTAGGSAGGAIQLVSRQTIRFTTAGAINASGGGGGYENTMGGSSAASGGGSGGGILLEAPVVQLPPGAFVAANGGGGGCSQTAGESGMLSQQEANGANCSGGAGDGGDGGSATNQTADNGTDGGGGAATAGGGGGSSGRIRVNLLGATIGNQLFSPAPDIAEINTR